MSVGEGNTAGRVFVGAPYQSGPMVTGMIQGVWVSDEEEVEWIWSHWTDGTSSVTGYVVKQKSLRQDKFELPETKETKETI